MRKVRIIIEAELNPDVMMDLQSFRDDPELASLPGLRKCLQRDFDKHQLLSLREDWLKPISVTAEDA